MFIRLVVVKQFYVPITMVFFLLVGCNGQPLTKELDTVKADNIGETRNDKLTQTQRDIHQGKNLFNQACAGCHGKDLAGGAGFNLKDGEWIHGKTKEKLIYNISNGFSNAGMPAFSNIYSQKQIGQVGEYVMSKREGFDNLTYAVYELDNKHDQSIEGDEPIKTGRLTNNLADFSIPEIPEYGITFSGDLFAPQDQESTLHIEGPAWRMINTLKINGKDIQRSKYAKNKMMLWPLQKGKQHIEVTFLTSIPTGLKKGQISKMPKRDLSMVVANETGIVRLFPLSTKAKAKMEDVAYKITATSEEVVVRKKVYNLPNNSIAVGLPSKVNYAFNSESCDIVGVWQGDLLDIGPNIEGRGQGHSNALGKFVLTYPNYLGDKTKTQPCDYKMYERLNTTRFHYERGGVSYVITASSTDDNNLRFTYSLEAINSETLNKITLNLPIEKQLSYSSNVGEIINSANEQVFNIEFTQHTEFYIDIQFSGAK